MRNSIVLYRMSFFVNDIIKSEISKRPISYGEYLRKEKVRDKEERHNIIKNFYNFIKK